jgi:hypothetical protein
MTLRALECTKCGLTYRSSKVPQYLLSASGASCPRCGSTLTHVAAQVHVRDQPRTSPRPLAATSERSERHETAMRQSAGWAEDAAREGDYAGALAWLATIEAVAGELPRALEARRRAWAALMRPAKPGTQPTPTS